VPSRFELFSERVHAQLNDPTVVRLVGRKNLAAHEQARRIVWIHAPSTVDRPSQAGGKVVGSSTTGTRQQAVWMRLENAEVHVFAETEELVDQLFDNVLAAIDLAIPRVRLDGYVWVTEQEGQAGLTLWQPAIMFRCAFRLPVMDERKQLAPITAQEHECSLITDATAPFPPPDP
jgi:hypothetical protein